MKTVLPSNVVTRVPNSLLERYEVDIPPLVCHLVALVPIDLLPYRSDRVFCGNNEQVLGIELAGIVIHEVLRRGVAVKVWESEWWDGRVVVVSRQADTPEISKLGRYVIVRMT